MKIDSGTIGMESARSYQSARTSYRRFTVKEYQGGMLNANNFNNGNLNGSLNGNLNGNANGNLNQSFTVNTDSQIRKDAGQSLSSSDGKSGGL